VVLNFTDATDAIEKNGLLVAELIQEVQAQIDPSTSLALVGASMGGLCSRYALSYLESHGIPHRVRTWISFDSPQAGADIPLGLQHWINFFSGQSADASPFKAKDIFRASGLPLLGTTNVHVAKDEHKIKNGQALSPLLLVRDSANGKLIIADGYHRLCAVYSFDEDAVIPCRIV
jgi:pimeloyl-ACP methyl ester carboxylesterase